MSNLRGGLYHGPREVPTIDLSPLLSKNSPQNSMVVNEIGRACQTFGLFNVINHGVSDSLMKEALDVNSEFFNIPVDEKRDLMSSDIHMPVRFGTVTEDRGDGKFTREFLRLYADPVQDYIAIWPQNPPDYREKMGAYAQEVRKLSIHILKAIMESLNLVSTTVLQEKINQGMQTMAVNRYKTGPEGHVQTGIGVHTDHGLVTILLQGSPGLYMMDLDEVGAWKLVPISKGSLQVIVGDQLQVLSNGIYKSALHRADPSQGDTDRFSVVSVLSFAMDEVIEPAGELVDDEHPKGYQGCSLRGFLKHLASKDVTPYTETLRIGWSR